MKDQNALSHQATVAGDYSCFSALRDRPDKISPTPPSTQILVVEDDENLARLLKLALQKEGYEIVTAANGVEALQTFAMHHVDMVLLDINMPKMNGFHVCAELRKHTLVPIIFITGKTRTDDLVAGLELGADSYITKPFTMQEIRARVRALLQRVHASAQRPTPGILRIGEIVLDEEKLEVFVQGKPVSLTPSEFRLLRYLMHNPDQLISKEQFLRDVWDYQSAEDVNFIRVTIRRLRSKIEEDPTNPRYLKTVHGVGYQLQSH